MTQVGRIAMRHEGENWNAYYALPDSMNDPIFLGSIRMGAAVSNPLRRLKFIELMRDLVSDIIEQETGIRPTWGGPTAAPEHERAGSS